MGAAAIGVRSALEASGPEERAGTDLEPSEIKFVLGATIVRLGLEETIRVGGAGKVTGFLLFRGGGWGVGGGEGYGGGPGWPPDVSFCCTFGDPSVFVAT